MNLEEKIQLSIKNKLEDGTVEKIITENIEKGLNECFKDLFGWSGEGRKTIETQIKSIMIPYLEKYDYSEYIIKLDHTLTNIIKETTKDNRKILENFKTLMSVDLNIKSIKVSDLFNKWCEYVKKNVETNGLEVEYEDEVQYECVEVSYEFESIEKRNWIKQEKGRLIFECNHDENMNTVIDLKRYSDINKKNMWNFYIDDKCDLNSLRYLDEFKVYLLSLQQANVEIELDEEDCFYCIRPEKTPEPYYE